MSCIQEQPTEGVRPNAGKMARSDPRPSGRVTRGGGGQHLASVLQEGRENANIGAGLAFIWRISVNTITLDEQVDAQPLIMPNQSIDRLITDMRWFIDQR